MSETKPETVEQRLLLRKTQFEDFLAKTLPKDKQVFLAQLKTQNVTEFVLFLFFKKRYTKYVSKIFYLMFLVFCFSFWYNTILNELVYLQNNRLSNYHFPTRCCSSGSKITGVLNPATRGGKRERVE